MVGGPGLRFALEAAFLVVLAVAAGIAELSATTIVIVMGAAWLLVAAIEWLAWREGPRVTRVSRVEPVAERPAPRRWRFWRREPSEAPEPTPAEAPVRRTDEDTADLDPLPEEPAAARADDGSRS